MELKNGLCLCRGAAFVGLRTFRFRTCLPRCYRAADNGFSTSGSGAENLTMLLMAKGAAPGRQIFNVSAGFVSV
jgi:hypothetical protein